MRAFPPLLLLAPPARANEVTLPLSRVDRSMSGGLGLVAPAAAAGLNRAKVQT